MQEIIDQTMPGDKWTFDESVTQVFENMLARSIPQCDTMRQLSGELACEFAQDNTWIVDLGCLRGDALRYVLSKRGALNRYVGIEVSEPMIAAGQ